MGKVDNPIGILLTSQDGEELFERLDNFNESFENDNDTQTIIQLAKGIALNWYLGGAMWRNSSFAWLMKYGWKKYVIKIEIQEVDDDQEMHLQREPSPLPGSDLRTGYAGEESGR